MNEDLDNFRKYYFEFASRDTLLERKNIDKQCSGMSMISVLKLYLHSRFFHILIFFSLLFADVIGLLTKIKKLESRIIMKNTANPRKRDIREIELLISK